MAGWFFYVVGAVALVLVVAAWRVLLAMRRAAQGETPVAVHARSGSPGEEIALRLTLARPRGRGRSVVKGIAVEGDLARALALRPPKGFVPDPTGKLRYEDFEPDLEALADRLDEERPRTIEVSHLIQQLQREQFDEARKRRSEFDAVQYTGEVAIGDQPLVLELPGRPIPEAAGKIWIATSHRIGAAIIDEIVVLDLPELIGAAD